MDTNNPPEGLDDFLAEPISTGTQNTNSVPTSMPVQAAPNDSAPQGMDEFLAPEINEEKYGGLGGNVATGLESLGSGLSVTASRHLEDYLGKKYDIPELSLKNQFARQEAAPVADFAGEAIGYGTVLAVTGGLGGIGEVGAEKAASTAVKTATEAALKEGLSGEALASVANAARASALGEYTAGQRIISQGLKVGIESAAYSSGNETVKMIFGDPDQTVSSALANVGLNGALGFVLGGSLGGAGELWKSKFGKGIANSLEETNSALEGPTANVPFSDPYNLQGLSKSRDSFKTGAGEILAASDRLGISPSKGMLSGDSIIGHLEEELSKEPTIAGNILRKEKNEILEKLQSHAKSTLEERTEKSELQVGREIKEGIVKQLDSELKPIEQGYKAEEVHMKNMLLSDAAKAEAMSPLVTHPSVASESSLTEHISKKAVELADDISKLKTVNDVKTFRTALNNEINKAVRAGDNNLTDVLMTAKRSLTKLRERGIVESALDVAGKEGNSIASDTVARIKDLDTRYAAYKTRLKQFGVESGTGTINNARSLLERFGKLSDESMATKVFDTGDINQLGFFKQHFPKQFELAKQFKLKEIYEKSIDHAQGRDGAFSLSKFLRQVRQLGPEAQEILFPGKAQMFKDLHTTFQAFPGAFNTSNTAAAITLGRFLTPGGIVDNLTGAAKLAFIKASPHLMDLFHQAGSTEAAQIAVTKIAAMGGTPPSPTAFKAMVDYIAKSIRGENAIGKAVKAVFEGGPAVLPSKFIPSEKDREKLNKRLLSMQVDPSSLYDVAGELGHYMPEHGIGVAKVTSNAVNYLNSIRPTPVRLNPLDEEIPVPHAEQEAFNNALDIANQPLLVLDKLKKGVLVPEDIGHLQNLYPSLYENLVQKLSHNLIETVHNNEVIPYTTKMGLALFTGQPLDSTMTPEGIMAAQFKSPQSSDQNEMPKQGAPHSYKNLSKLAQGSATPGQSREQTRSMIKA